MAEPPFQVLLVEDDVADQLLLKEAADLSGLPCTLHFTRDGHEALAFLRRPGGVRPHLVLLDLNMPGKGGLEVLREARADPALRSLPIVVLTNSNAAGDVTRCYAAGASAYVCKSMQLETFLNTVQTTLTYWCQGTLLPG
ncbi:response regulator [Deinococcus koreensis]|uniref:Response regulator n=1 Tax=Deinococcus koreensis TaxID=2054903 RepID=A0A2K3USF4_9DEIO|nr:response regulator [Deinococcus koreensis]PNY79475.1 response regulator [Deinococcus koreensis]